MRVRTAERVAPLARDAHDRSTPRRSCCSSSRATSPAARTPTPSGSSSPTRTRRWAWRWSTPDGRFRRANPALCRLLGRTMEDLLERSIFEVVADEQAALTRLEPRAAADRRAQRLPGRDAPAAARRPGRGRARERDAHAQPARRAPLLRLPVLRPHPPQRGPGAPGRQRGQAGRGPAARAAGQLGVGDRDGHRRLVGRAVPDLRRAARPLPRAPTAATWTRSTPTTAPAWRGSSRRAVAERRSWSLDYRVVRPDGEIRMIHARGEVVLDDHGRPRSSAAPPRTSRRAAAWRTRCAPPSSCSAARSTTRRSAWRSSTSRAAGCG